MAGHRGALQAQQFARVGKLRGDTTYAVGARRSFVRTADKVTVYTDGSRTSSTVPGATALLNETFSFDAGQYTALSGIDHASLAPAFRDKADLVPHDEVMISFSDGTTVTLQDVANLEAAPVKF
jgi:hypothetical protein